MASRFCIEDSGTDLHRIFSGGGEMMLKFGDLNLNHSVQVFGDSTMESLKQAMLQHEFIFRNQVRELHRLYWTQKNLMNEFRLKRFDSLAPCSTSFAAPPIGSKDSLEKRNAFSVSYQSVEIWNSLSRNVGALEEFKGHSSSNALKNHDIDFSLNLPADDFSRRNGKDPTFYHPGVLPVNFTNGGLGETKSENIIRCYARKRKEVIDREDSVELECHKPTIAVPCAQVSLMPSVSRLNEEDGVGLQEQKPSSSSAGLQVSPMATSDDQPRKKGRAASPMPFDLNEPLEHDEQSNSFHDNASILHNLASSANTATKISWDKDDCSLDSKLAHNTIDDREDAKNSAGMARACPIEGECREKPTEGSTDSSYRVFVRRNASSISSTNLSKEGKDAGIKRRDSNITSSNSTNLQQTVVNMDLIAKPAGQEGSEEDITSSHGAQALYVHSRKIVLNTAERSADDSITTQLTSSQNEELDATISVAAEILVKISSECRAIPTEQLDGTRAPEPESNDADDLPQSSSDSFERMTLQLSEVRSEDRRSMIEQSSVDGTGRKGRGPGLRRGRGFRDFQKEILPGLVTLSRHEICEDLHDIGHERRRIVSRDARDSWFVPVRNRRSNLPSGRRRR
ncbi:hypothetical protein KSP40_PGU020763 [Platanthera guangdongensis]|uniref:Uncharacterized protein n=1 Tax=Platanthera guangdongensis TaxID=2320717 RepID=A0ABR2MKE3_9ASPA